MHDARCVAEFRHITQVCFKRQDAALDSAVPTCDTGLVPVNSPMLQGLDVLAPSLHAGNLARPRLFEVGAAINRLRSVKMRQQW